MDEAYRRWRPPKSHSSFRRRALVFIGYVCHRFRRAFVKVFWRRHVSQSVVNPLLLVLVMLPVSTIALSPLIAVPSITVSLTLMFSAPLLITPSVLVSLVSIPTTSRVSCLERPLLAP